MYNYYKQSIVNIIKLSNSVLRAEKDKNNLFLLFCLFYQDKIKIPFENYKESSFLYLNNENLSNKQLKNFNEDFDDNENTEFSINKDSENNKSIEKILNIYTNSLKQINEGKEHIKPKKTINQNKLYRNKTPLKNTIRNNDFINNDENNNFCRNSKSNNNSFYNNKFIDEKNKKKKDIIKERERLINIIAKKFTNFDKYKKKRNEKKIKEKQQKVTMIDYKFDFDAIRGKKKMKV